MTDKRREEKEQEGLTPDYEDENPVINKVTLAPKTEFEKTILLRVPRGKQARKQTAELIPFLAGLDAFNTEDTEKISFKQFGEAVDTLWGEDQFEDEIVPFVFDFKTPKEKKYLENLTLMEMFEGFMKAATYVLTGGASDEAFEEARSKSRGEGGGEKDNETH